MRWWAFAAVVFLGTAVAQRTSTDSTGDYILDLGQVHGAIRGVKSLEEICSKDFPATREANQRAYDGWRKKYLPFAQEMERHFSAMAWRESKQDPKEHMAFLARYDRMVDQHKQGLREQFASDGQAAFRKQCELFSAYVNSPRMNLESFYAEQVATIRRGRK